MNRKLTIAIDYSGTWSSDPDMWKTIAEIINTKHEIIMVTSMPSTYEKSLRNQIEMNIPIIFTSGKSKRIAALQAGYDVDIWIDDIPEFIGI